jgi:tetratricopeptide (TPR) repeat protein
MKRFVAPLVVFTSVLLAATSTHAQMKWLRSSAKYTQGTEALANGQYQEAAALLAEAVEMDPSLSRNHANYSAALFELGRYSDGWPHARKAVLLDPENLPAQSNSRRYIQKLLQDAGLQIGAPVDEVVRALGEPDNIADQIECTFYQYGVSALCFKNKVFAFIGDMQWKRRR